jgi:hypothetical protein
MIGKQMGLILVGILTTKPLIFIKKVGVRAGGHEQGRLAQLIYIIKEFVHAKKSLSNRNFLSGKRRRG